MKKILTCAGVVAVGATSLQAQYVGDAAPTKAWSFSTKIYGFYDDNYTTLPSNRARSSFGTGVTPSFGYTFQRDVTAAKLQYTYDMRWYEDRVENEMDQSHQADLNVNHAFGQRSKVDLNDSFVIAQEPELLEPGTRSAYIRSDGNNMRNTASINIAVDLTKKLSMRLGYSNSIYDYDQTGDASRSALLDRVEHLASIDFRWQFRPETTGLIGYQYGIVDQTGDEYLFDRYAAMYSAAKPIYDTAMEVYIPAWTNAYQPAYDTAYSHATTATNAGGLGYSGADAVGYAKGRANDSANAAGVAAVTNSTDKPYSGSDMFLAISGKTPDQRLSAANRDKVLSAIPRSDARDNESHYFFVGVDHNFNPKLSTQVRAGAQYTKYPNASPTAEKDNIVPYADVKVGYRYGEGSMAQVGAKYSRYQTDVAVLSSLAALDSLVTFDQESLTIYASVNHRITPKLRGILRVQYQTSQFNQGAADEKSDTFFGVDASVEYEMPKVWKLMTLYATGGYMFDKLDSDLADRGFTRNRAYLGFRASF